MTRLDHTAAPAPTPAVTAQALEAALVREFGERETADARIRACRGHFHTQFNVGGASFADAATAQAYALREWATMLSAEDVHLLESLATAEEDRFNESGMYIPNEIPATLRRIAQDLVTRRALAAALDAPALRTTPTTEPAP